MRENTSQEPSLSQESTSPRDGECRGSVAAAPAGKRYRSREPLAHQGRGGGDGEYGMPARGTAGSQASYIYTVRELDCLAGSRRKQACMQAWSSTATLLSSSDTHWASVISKICLGKNISESHSLSVFSRLK